MTTVRDIYTCLDGKWHFGNMPNDDNSGLLIGDPKAVVTSVLTCLDITSDVIRQAVGVGAQLIVSHHPIIFDALKSISAQGPVYEVIRAGIAVISLHIPVDEAIDGANAELCRILGFTPYGTFIETDGIKCGRICQCMSARLPRALTAGELAKTVCDKLKCPVVYSDGGKPINSVAVCGGSGGFLINDVVSAGIDCLISSRFRHSDVLFAASRGVSTIDATHFATEIHIPQMFAQLLRAEFSDLSVTVADETNPLKAVVYGD